MTFLNQFITDYSIEFRRNKVAPIISNTTGKVTKAQYEVIYIDCCIRSTKGLGSKIRDQGFMDTQDLVIYSNIQLFPDRNGMESDTFTYKGESYKINSVVNNYDTFIKHYKLLK